MTPLSLENMQFRTHGKSPRWQLVQRIGRRLYILASETPKGDGYHMTSRGIAVLAHLRLQEMVRWGSGIAKP